MSVIISVTISWGTSISRWAWLVGVALWCGYTMESTVLIETSLEGDMKLKFAPFCSSCDALSNGTCM